MRKMRKLVIMVCIAAMIMTNIPNWDAGADVSGTVWSETGDTLVGNATVWKDEVITLSGNLTINETGSLTLDNVTLLMNCITNGSYYIEVQPGGEMYILNNSNITSVNENAHYNFSVRNDSKFEMRDSELSGCGYEWGMHGDHDGLWINTDDTIIYNSSFSNCLSGILLYQVKNFCISNCSFSNNNVGIYLLQSTNISIKECSFLNNTYGTVADSSSEITIVGCDYVSNGNTIYSKSDNRNPRIIVLNPSAINCYNSSGIEVIDCILSENNYGICLRDSSNSTISNCTISSNNETGISILSSDNNTISNCTISSNNNKGIYLNSSSNNQIINCTAYNNYNAIYLYASSNNQIVSAIIYNNSHDGIQLCYSSNNKITNCAAYNNTHTGISLFYSSNNKITNCSIYNNTYGAVLYDSSNNQIVNSTIIDSTGYDLSLAQNSQLISLNTTFNKTSIYFDDVNSTLNVSWYLNVNVLWNNSIPAEYANVRIFDSLMSEVFNASTDVNGWVKNIIIQEYTQNQTAGKTFFTPHNVTAWQGVFSNSTNVTVNRTQDFPIIFTDHNGAPIVTDYYPKLISPVIGAGTYVFNVSAYDPDDEDDFTYQWYLNEKFQYGENSSVYILHADILEYNRTYHVSVVLNDSKASSCLDWYINIVNISNISLINQTELLENLEELISKISYVCANLNQSNLDELNITLHGFYEKYNVLLNQTGLLGNIKGLMEQIEDLTEQFDESENNAANLSSLLDELNITLDQLNVNIAAKWDALNTTTEEKNDAENKTKEMENKMNDAIEAKNKAEYELGASVVCGVIGGIIAGFLVSFLLRRKLPKKG